ncbi:MAG: hypothetical protein E5X80_08590 [Mesorhizobium sp.]|nr:MAG: hypothetical protein EOR71_24900 [Mesorhizobium sp.]TIO53924.1 MAG: hypothetical protein E5X78_06130 [Mesorhizobium sp.]TIO61551.1 MAG: hypothetical protein E5X79_07275 [Mesorhizobium sp.]TJV65937.1 MAG: hypothetical protein E5X80_08590 [Mesorhizobium sp.]
MRSFVLNEPRGGVFRHVNLLVPPKHPSAQFGWIIMEPEDTPPMSGSNAICVATVLLDSGIVQMVEPVTYLTLEAPGGLISVEAHCRNGKAERIAIRNVASFADKLDAEIEVPGIGTLKVDTAYGGDSFVLVDAASIGVELISSNAREIAEVGGLITAAANAQLGFDHPLRSWKHISFCQMTDPTFETDGTIYGKSAVTIRPGKIDRSPCGTGCSARMAVLHARGLLKVGQPFVGRSLLDTEFHCKIAALATVGSKSGIEPVISGRGWIIGNSQLLVDPDDPFQSGYRLSDTWPSMPN